VPLGVDGRGDLGQHIRVSREGHPVTVCEPGHFKRAGDWIGFSVH